MKKLNLLLMSLFMAMMLLLGGSAYAQVANFSAFDGAFQALKDTPAGGDITVTGNINFADPGVYDLSTTGGRITITLNATTASLRTTNALAALTVGKNITIQAGTTVPNAANGMLNATAGEIIIADATTIITGANNSVMLASGGKITIANGTITSTTGSIVNATTGNLEITGGTLTSTGAAAAIVYLSSSATATIGGTTTMTNTVPGDAATAGGRVIECTGTSFATITGGTFKSGRNAVTVLLNGGSALIEGGNFSVVNNIQVINLGNVNSSVEITGGTFTNDYNAAVLYVRSGATANIKGGTFKNTSTGYVIDANGNTGDKYSYVEISGSPNLTCDTQAILLLEGGATGKITGGTLTTTGASGNRRAVYVNNANSYVNITGGTFTGSGGSNGTVYITSGSTASTIFNATITNTSGPAINIANSSFASFNGCTISSAGGHGVVFGGSSSATITGGSITTSGSNRVVDIGSTGTGVSLKGVTMNVGEQGRAIYSQGTATIEDVTINLGGANSGTTGLWCNSADAIFNIKGNLNISGTGTDLRLYGASKVFIFPGATGAGNMSVTNGTGAATDAVIFDYNKPFTISATPISGTQFPDAASSVTLSINNPNTNAYPGYVGIYYTLDGSDPALGGGTYYTTPIPITASSVTIRAIIGRSGAIWNGVPDYPFTYTVAGLDPAHPTYNVTTFDAPGAFPILGLKQAFEASQEPIVQSSKIIIGGDFAITGVDFDMTPVKPVTIQMDNSITTGAGTIFGGALTIDITGTVATSKALIIGGGNTTFNPGLTIIGNISGDFPNIMTPTSPVGIPVLTIKGGTYTSEGHLLRLNTSGKAIIDDGSFTVNTARSLLQLQNGAPSAEINGGTFKVLGVNTNARAFHMNTGSCQLTINGGTITVGSGGRGIHINNGGSATLTINRGIFTMDGSDAGSRVIFVNNNNSSNIAINDGSFNTGGGYFIGFGSATNSGICVIRKATIVGAVYSKYTGETGNQLVYDFRGYNDNLSASPAPMKISSSTMVSLDVTGTFDPVDAADAATYYYTTMGSNPPSGAPSLKSTMDVGAGGAPYTAPFSVSPGETVHVYFVKDAIASNETLLTYDVSTGITDPSVNESAAYIANNTLFLPESAQSVQVYAVGGQLILNAVATGTTIDVSSLTKGIYIVKADGVISKVAK